MKTLVVYVLKSGLKQYYNVRRLWPNADVGFIDCDDYYGPTGYYDRVILVDSTVVSGVTFARAVQVLERYVIYGELLKAGAPLVEGAPVDIILPRPAMSEKRTVFITGFSATGKTGLARGLAQALGEPLVKWGKLVAKHYNTGLYGEGVNVTDYELAYSLLPELEEKLRRAKRFLIIDGVKSPEQVIVISYALLAPALTLFVDTRPEYRLQIATMRRMPDDKYFKERDRLFFEGLVTLRKVGYRVAMDSQVIPDTAIGFFKTLGVRPEILDRFNPYITKKNLLLNYYGMVKNVSPADFEVKAPLLKGYSLRYGDERLDYLATSVRLIDDILDEHTVRFESETGRVVPAYWYENSIAEAVLEAVKLVAKFKAETMIDPSRAIYYMVVGVMRELELEESRRRPTPDDWLVSAVREVAFRAFIAEWLGLDKEREMIRGLRAQAKDDVLGRRKGGREDTEERLNRPTYDRVIGLDYKWIGKAESLEDVLERLGASKGVRELYNRILSEKLVIKV
ncbi:hypothetical protein [Pyrococcus kukulkanii]|uniref:ATPase AAA n=1 Tax=Pyrococcus kukulkanii TaxID=1609559 RepID=A0ABV4T6B0_9EURY